MREVGISVYPDFYSVESIKSYLNRAKELGMSKVFISLILGNQGFENARKPDRKEIAEILGYCKHLDLEVSADINLDVFKEFGCDLQNLSPLTDMGVTKLRLDGGFTIDQIVELTKSIPIEINASISSNEEISNELSQLSHFLESVKMNGNIENVSACHNFFPLPDTGLSLQEIKLVNKILKDYGVKIGGFVASQFSSKDLHHLGHGVCTIEAHRYLPAHIAMTELFMNDFDYVLVGDSMAMESELTDMARCANQDFIEIPVIFYPFVSDEIKSQLLEITFLSRIDQPHHLIRATASRGIVTLPCYCAPRPTYTLTLNNNLSAQYMGELQITLQDLGNSVEHNVIGFIHPFAHRLMDSIKFGRNSFKLAEV